MTATRYAEVVTDLKVIARLRVNDKVRLDGHAIRIDPPSHLQFAWRMLNGDSRSSSIPRIQEVVRFAISFIRDANCPQNCRSRVADALGRSRVGLSNLATTYTEDAYSAATLENLIDEIDEAVDCESFPDVPTKSHA